MNSLLDNYYCCHILGFLGSPRIPIQNSNKFSEQKPFPNRVAPFPKSIMLRAPHCQRHTMRYNSFVIMLVIISIMPSCYWRLGQCHQFGMKPYFFLFFTLHGMQGDVYLIIYRMCLYTDSPGQQTNRHTKDLNTPTYLSYV